MIPKYKANNYKTWNQFDRICAVLQYPIEYFDYFSQKYNYCGERNIDEYNKIYRKAFNDQNVKNEKFQENIQKKFIMVIAFLEIGLNKKIQIILQNQKFK